MKILQIVPALEQGGVELDAVELALSLKSAGVENAIASAGGALVAKLSSAGITHHELPLATKNLFRLRANAARIARLVTEEQYDLVHVRSRAPAWSVCWAAKSANFPWLATYHGVYGTEPKWFKLRYNRVMLAGLKTICVSDFVRRHVESVYAPPPGQLVTIHDGADTSRFYPGAVSTAAVREFKRSLGFTPEMPLVVMVGRLTRWKGQHLVLQAAAQMQTREFGLVFVGSNQGRVEYSAELRALADRLPTGRRAVFLERFDDMPLIYAAGTVAVNASSGQPEAFGRVIPEAQAIGTPVIGTAHGGACETIADGVTGFLIPPGDIRALAERLDYVLSMEASARARLVDAEIHSVRENFSIATTCKRTLSVYRQVLESWRQ